MSSINKKIIEIQGAPYPKKASVYPAEGNCEKGAVLYFHGGGLLYGSREDLPEGHIQAVTGAGFTLVSFDYPLAPAAKLPDIYADVFSSIEYFLRNPEAFGCETGPYFLWGRSAGAYLCLLTAAKGNLSEAPSGILSYYGYGFLCDGWFLAPDPYYRSLPAVPASCLDPLPKKISAEGSLEKHYSAYVYARQSGNWLSLLYEGRQKYFYTDYTLRLCGALPCPLFAAHSTGDPDVPFSEYQELLRRYHARPFLVSGSEHDFDRNPYHPFTRKLLEESVRFMEECL